MNNDESSRNPLLLFYCAWYETIQNIIYFNITDFNIMFSILITISMIFLKLLLNHFFYLIIILNHYTMTVLIRSILLMNKACAPATTATPLFTFYFCILGNTGIEYFILYTGF